jgi:hypothetical protein
MRQCLPTSAIIAPLCAGLWFVIILTIVVCTLNVPGRFIFIPGGDVGLGFRSFRGNLEWIEYAPWSRNPEYVDTLRWSVSWWPIVLVHAIIAFTAICRCIVLMRHKTE